MSSTLPDSFEPLRDQLLAAAQQFASDAEPLGAILSGIVDDVERATAEPLQIFPVCHHSPSSAVQMVRFLTERAPKVIYMECCEDLQPLLEGLPECQLPVALQAFSSGSDAFPAAWSPLSLVCPLTEFSAEFQAIAYAQTHPETELLFVDRSSDHVYQWMPREQDPLADQPEDEPVDPDDDSGADLHGSALGIEMGATIPTFGEFAEFLIKNARVQHYSEWWDQYVEEVVIGSSFSVYRQVMFLIGSLIRRLGQRPEDIAEDEMRERFMWTRMKTHLQANQISPGDAIYVCGAAHSASRVEEFGVESDALWDIPPYTETKWLYGLLPSSYAAIERQFSHPSGSVSLADARWKKQLKLEKLRPFRLDNSGSSTPTKKAAKKKAASPTAPTAPDPTIEEVHPLLAFLQRPPELIAQDEEELLQQCVRIVAMARKHGYMASTADSIAIYQTAVLLSQMRNRKHPTPWDFRDAAVTCLEKDNVPKKRDIAKLCEIMLGGDRIGKIGYESMPPLARDVYDRLAILPASLDARNIQRTLLDFRKHPEYLPASDLLWKLRYLLPQDVVRPIMGQRELGHTMPQQESWDLAIGRNQGAIIQLGYEGITIEHVLERRLKKAALHETSRTIDALKAVEDSILFLKNERLTTEIGEHSVHLLVDEPDVSDAAEIYKQISRLIHYFRSSGGLPDWCGHFVTTGYRHYCTLLPNAFADRGVKPTELAAMLQFILTLESLALSLGCERTQLIIAIKQSRQSTTDPTKLAVLWSVECVLQLQDIPSLRRKFDSILGNELALHGLPDYLGGFLLSLSFTPVISAFTVELMSKAFSSLPDRVLMPWLPKLLMTLRSHSGGALGTLLKDAVGVFPTKAEHLLNWVPPWDRPEKARDSKPATQADPALTPQLTAARTLLSTFPESITAWVSILGVEGEWGEVNSAEGPISSGANSAPAKLLSEFPETLEAWVSQVPN